MEEEKNVYDIVNEDEYSEIVRQRQDDDWIVDDGEMKKLSIGIDNLYLENCILATIYRSLFLLCQFIVHIFVCPCMIFL